MTGRDAERAQLGAALTANESPTYWDWAKGYLDTEAVLDALLPVVDRIANQRAAAALREAASDVDDGEFSDRWSDAARRALLARADQLDPS